MKLKEVLHSDAFKIYFWPIVIFYLLSIGMLILFLPMEPGSVKETVFVCIGNVIVLSFLWYLFYRYKKIKLKPIGKRAKTFLIILTIAGAIGLIFMLYDVLQHLIFLNS